MVPAGLSETIELLWHFAGYMRLEDDGNITIPIDYEGDARHPLTGDPLSLTLVNATLPSPDELFSAPSPKYEFAGPDGYQFHVHVPSIQEPHLRIETPAKIAPLHLAPFSHPLDSGGDGGGGDFSLSVTYAAGGDQEIFDLRQINVTSNDDVFGDGPFGIHLQLPHSSAAFALAMSEAQEAVPAALAPPWDHTSSGFSAYIGAHDANFQQIETATSPYSVRQGQYLDGVLQQDSSADVHTSANDALAEVGKALSAGTFAPAPPTGDHSADHIQDVYLGSNTTANDAVVAGFNGLCGSMVVLGDYYQTNLISQTNVLAQSNWLNVYGSGASSSQVVVDPNAVHNAAEFQTVGGIEGPWMVGGPTHWNVDVLDGSLYDVKSFVQTNYLSDNDLVSQTQSIGESQIVAGSNGLVNALDFQNLSAQYDLIIVEGGYHQANMIYQTNVLVDFTHGWQIGDGTNGEAAGGAIRAGGDALINDATVIYQGATGSQSVSQGILDLVHALDAKDGTLTAAQIEASFPYLAGSANVLVVTGDYYDLTYLSQTNIVRDSNSAAQVMLAANGQQSMTTGHDVAVNSAIVIDGGSLTTPYVQGQTYSDSLLIQTNIVATDQKITVNDPSQLAPELVAFTGDHGQPAADAPQLFGPDPQHHADGVACVMHA